jgi:hypothetical protein
LKYFSKKSFEHLLFKLHLSVYQEIDRKLAEHENLYPGTLGCLCTIYDRNFSNASTQGVFLPGFSFNTGSPPFDVHVNIDERQMRRVHKCDRVSVVLAGQPVDQSVPWSCSNHLIVGFKTEGVLQNFIVPLPLLLQVFESRVCKPNTYQVYQHTLIRKKASFTGAVSDYVEGSGSYVGITSRTWQQRDREHVYAARRGSPLLFHRALAGKLFDLFAHEHIVLRAGLTRPQALQIEEIEVEENTLHGTHPDGLNMIPGGEAGLRFLSSMTKRPVKSIQIEEIDTLLEAAVNNSLRPQGSGHAEAVHQPNAKLVARWREDMVFRIKAMTHQGCRMSYPQICNARIWHASGWSIQKIHAALIGMEEGRSVTQDQVQSLLEGKTYSSIPHVLIPLDGMKNLNS